MKVFILTEAAASTGFGHLTRCTSLYQAFLEKNITPTFIIDADDTSSVLLEDLPHIILAWQKNAEELLPLLSTDDIVIIDSYIADISIYKQISKRVNLTVYIDDNNRIEYPKGIIVNGTIFSEDINYKKNPLNKYLLGSTYAPIRKEFWDIPAKSINDEVVIMMITFGGDDIRNLTIPVVEFLQKESMELHKYVIAGNAFQNKEKLMAMSDHSTEILTSLSSEDMLQIMLKSDIAISAAGQTLNELARVGVPTIAVQIADNQKSNVHGFSKSGFIEFAGNWNDKNLENQIKKSIANIYSYDTRLEKNKIGKKYIDGQGARRIIQTILDTVL